jgi:hypothetical protein
MVTVPATALALTVAVIPAMVTLPAGEADRVELPDTFTWEPSL